MKHDINTSEDVKIMVDTFYEKVNADGLLSNIFNDVAKVDWPSHLPKMYLFWESILFSSGGYQGNPFQKHIPLPIDASHFEKWLEIFIQNVDEHFVGERAEEAKHRANTIAHIFKTKLAHINHHG